VPRSSSAFERALLLTILLTILVMTAGCTRAVPVAGSVGGMNGTARVAAAGTTIYVASIDALSIVDAADPASPRTIGQLHIPGRVLGVATDGRHVYVSVAYYRAHIDMPVFKTWQKKGWILLPDSFYTQDIYQGGSNVLVVDPAKPSEPEVVGVVALNARPQDDLIVEGGRLYMPAADLGVWIIDVSDPRQPRTLSNPKATAQGIAVNGQTLVVARGAAVHVSGPEGERNYRGGVGLIDVSNPTQPVERGGLTGLQLGQTDDSARVEHVAAAGRYVYANALVSINSTVKEYLTVIDISNPDAPVLAAQVAVPEPIGALLIKGARLYLTGNGPRPTLTTLDVSDPAAPKVLTTETLEGDAAGNLVAGPDDVLYLGQNNRVSVL